MGYKKDIVVSFAYEFELSQKNEILADARMKSAKADEIFGFASDEIKSTHRRRGGFHLTKLDFIVEDDFTHPKGWI